MNYISQVGPVLPVQIAKKLEVEILFAGAILSDLVSRKKLKTTKKPIGSSPLYYMPGQEKLLEERLYPVMKGKEKEAYDILKEKSVLWERELEPWQRVALNDLKDFSVPIEVKLSNDVVTKFWRFHLIPETAVKELIQARLDQIKPEPAEEIEPVMEVAPAEEDIPPAPAEEIEPIREPVIEKVIEEIKPQKEEISSDMLAELKKQLLSELKNRAPKVEVQEKISPKPEVELTGKFFQKISAFFNNKEVIIIGKELIKKEKEFDFIINLPSPVGHLRYYVKAKDKSKVNESDLSLALSEAHSRKLPTLYLSNGELTKKAKDWLQRHQGLLVFKKV